MHPPAAKAGRRPACPRCALPLATCVCALAAPAGNAVDVLVLQHPHEAREARNSVRLLALSLARCRVIVGEVFEEPALLGWLHGEGRRSVLLYPEVAQAPALAAGACAPTQLVVIDGTWRKSLRMLMTNGPLRALPRLALAPGSPGRYGALRKARAAAQLSTLEATCEALSLLEGTRTPYAPVLAAFERFVAERLARVPRA